MQPAKASGLAVYDSMMNIRQYYSSAQAPPFPLSTPNPYGVPPGYTATNTYQTANFGVAHTNINYHHQIQSRGYVNQYVSHVS